MNFDTKPLCYDLLWFSKRYDTFFWNFLIIYITLFSLVELHISDEKPMNNKEIELVTYATNQGNVPFLPNNHRHQETNLSSRCHLLKSNFRSSSSCLFGDLNSKKDCTSFTDLDNLRDKKLNWQPVESEEFNVKKWRECQKSSLDFIVSKAVPGWFLSTNHRLVSAKSKAMTLNRSISSFTSYVQLEAEDMGDTIQNKEPVYPRQRFVRDLLYINGLVLW